MLKVPPTAVRAVQHDNTTAGRMAGPRVQPMVVPAVSRARAMVGPTVARRDLPTAALVALLDSTTAVPTAASE